jgi:glycosyltransferase involved in cell wall biosynthesis
MGKQVVVYDKESGMIHQIMSFGNIPENHLNITALGIGKRFDLTKVDIFIDNDERHINIKKDRIINGIITQPTARKEIIREQKQSNSIFDEVNFTCLPEHIGLITPWNKECGIADYSKDLVDNLLCRVTIFCEKNNIPEYHNSKVKIIPCWTNRDTTYTGLVELLKKNKIDIAHIQYNHDLMNAGQLKFFGNELKEAGIRSILTLHSTKGGVDVFGKNFDQIIVHSEISAKDLIGPNVNENQIKIIPIGSSKQRQIKSKKIACIEKNIDYNRPIISNFGFFLPQKGIKEQIKALQLLKQKIHNILLLVVCAIHKSNLQMSIEYYNECKQLADDLNLTNNIIFITEYLNIDESINYLQCSDIIILPYVNSASQATSSAGRTVLTCGRPVIVSDTEIFSDMKDYVIKVEPRNIEQLNEKTIQLLENKKLQDFYIQKISTFIEKTSWKNVAKEHMSFYKSFGDIKLDIEGQVYSYFSASVVNRNLACSLYDLGVDVSLQSVNLAENKDYEMGDKTNEITQRKPNNIIKVRHQFPPNFIDMNSRTKIMYLPAETSIPDDWVDAIEKNDIDFVWTYSSYGKEVMRNAGITKPIEIMRCGIDEHLFNKNVIPIDLQNIKDSHTKKVVDINEDTFVFMFVGHAQERKNFKTILKSYLTEFNYDENVVFVIKSYDGGEVYKTILEIVDFVSEVLEKPKDILPKYLYIYEDTDPQVLPSYFAAADTMVQCSRAEGFGKPILEAMALGIPSIVIPWSGPKDFCTEKNSFPVPYTLIKSTYHVQSKQGDSFWADTKVEDLRRVLRSCFENPEEVKKRGNEALLTSEKWTMKEVAFDFVEFVRKYNL